LQLLGPSRPFLPALIGFGLLEVNIARQRFQSGNPRPGGSAQLIRVLPEEPFFSYIQLKREIFASFDCGDFWGPLQEHGPRGAQAHFPMRL